MPGCPTYSSPRHEAVPDAGDNRQANHHIQRCHLQQQLELARRNPSFTRPASWQHPSKSTSCARCVGCNSCACMITDSPAYLILVRAGQVVVRTIEFASSDFLHRDPIFDYSTPFCTFPRRHTTHTNTCATWGLVFYTWVSSSEEPVEGSLR